MVTVGEKAADSTEGWGMEGREVENVKKAEGSTEVRGGMSG